MRRFRKFLGRVGATASQAASVSATRDGATPSRAIFRLRRSGQILLAAIVSGLGSGIALAQFPFQQQNQFSGSNGSLVRLEGGNIVDEDTVRTAREVESHSSGGDTPLWVNGKGFEKDVFTFTRVIFKTGLRDGVKYNQQSLMGYGIGPRFSWWVDFPDADLNFSYRLQQMTSTRVDPDGRVMKLTDPELFEQPFIYMEHPGYMLLKDDEVVALRKYLRNGGTLYINDFWSALEWTGFETEMQRVLPGETWVDLPLSHPIFNCVFPLEGPLKKLQVPTMQFWNRDHNPDDPNSPPLQGQFYRGEGSEEMHIRAWLDEKQRIRVIAIHNCDLSDGWEREGENPDYFHTFSEKISYPLGINIIFYMMTH